MAASVTGEGDVLRVQWRAPGERTPAGESVTVRSSAAGITWLSHSGPEPVWLGAPLTVAADAGAAVVAGDDLPAPEVQRWLDAARSASGVVAAAGLGPAASTWDATLVVCLPGTPERFAAASGLRPDVAAATQAATVAAAADSAPRIIANRQATGSLDAAARRALLIHEGVHAATRSAVSAAPLWLVEGVAESVAAAADPDTRRRNTELVAAASGLTGLPSRADLDGPAAPTAYARAALAVDAAIARWGRPAVMGWLADWTAPGRPDEAELTRVFQAALSAR